MVFITTGCRPAVPESEPRVRIHSAPPTSHSISESRFRSTVSVEEALPPIHTVVRGFSAWGRVRVLFSFRRNLSVKEIADQRDHFVGLVFQGEVAGVDQMKLRVGQVTPVRMRSVGWKDFVVLAPDNQRWRLAFAEVRLDPWVDWQIGPVVIKEIHLDVSITWPIE